MCRGFIRTATLANCTQECPGKKTSRLAIEFGKYEHCLWSAARQLSSGKLTLGTTKLVVLAKLYLAGPNVGQVYGRYLHR